MLANIHFTVYTVSPFAYSGMLIQEQLPTIVQILFVIPNSCNSRPFFYLTPVKLQHGVNEQSLGKRHDLLYVQRIFSLSECRFRLHWPNTKNQRAIQRQYSPLVMMPPGGSRTKRNLQQSYDVADPDGTNVQLFLFFQITFWFITTNGNTEMSG